MIVFADVVVGAVALVRLCVVSHRFFSLSFVSYCPVKLRGKEGNFYSVPPLRRKSKAMFSSLWLPYLHPLGVLRLLRLLFHLLLLLLLFSFSYITLVTLTLFQSLFPISFYYFFPLFSVYKRRKNSHASL